MKKIFSPVLAVVLAETLFYGALILGSRPAIADGVSDSIAGLQHEWVKAYYVTPPNQKVAAFKDIAAQAQQLAATYPARAEPLVWEAIILSSYAKFEGGLSALDKVKSARDLLEHAEKIQPDVLNGSIYTSLGSLYYKVPRWPISFGDKNKAREYLEKALKLNPNGIDPNYFYGDFLQEQGEYAAARGYLEKALAAPARPGREDADRERRVEVQLLLEKLKQHG
ncbi:MAG: hypothetical protein P4L77_09715 [Sulfuriferula sp.]|nr:hypothetical protein [Sulfuriferula sp.]